jgi:glycosyltransferase involved in cell wall biosynthesis
MRKNKAEHQSPYFSIVIPVFNRAATLGPTLESCLNQTFTDFEIIIVDDGSTDGLKAVVAAYEDPRIRYIWQENGGGSSARNTGIDVARGKYIAFLDSDDRFLESKLFKCHQYLKDNPCDCLYSQMLVDRGVGKYWIKPPRAILPGEHMADYLLCRRGWVPTSTCVVEKLWASRIRYQETLSCGDDMDFAIRLFNEGAKFHMLDEALVVCMDVPDPNRLSSIRNFKESNQWMESLRDAIPSKAYYGHRGWRLAKTMVSKSYFKAFLMYMNAIFHGAYSPKLALVIFCQIFFPRDLYRNISDAIAANFGKLKT